MLRSVFDKMKLPTVGAALTAALFFVGYTQCKPQDPTPSIPSAPTAAASSGGNKGNSGRADEAKPTFSVHAGNLSAQQLALFYHQPEGSEVLPLFLLRLDFVRSGDQQFMQNLGRFGLLEDAQSPTNPEGLPVGMTADVPRDLQFLGLKMTGFNCAACHVGELEAEHQRLRVVGAPAKFDIKRFYREFGEAIRPFVSSVSGTWKVFKAFQKERGVGAAAAALSSTAEPPATAAARRTTVDALDSFDPEKPSNDFERQLAAEVQRQHAEATKAANAEPPPAAAKGPPKALQNRAANALPTPPGARQALQADEALLPEPLRALPPASRELGLSSALSEFSDLVRLLVTRLKLASQIGGVADPVDAGPGRVDAFVTAKNIMFGTDDPPNSPVSYPHIWGIERLTWLHWDGNTNSVMERNMGQAIGLGAVFDSTGKSTLLPRKIHEMEVWTDLLTAPKWPFALDAARVERGSAVFARACAKCHGASPTNDESALDEIGTDPNRALNFGSKVKTQPLPQALGQLLAKIKQQAYTDAKPPVTPEEAKAFERGRVPVEWRSRRAYANRTLEGVWATAPYLHNGSVPTLAQLLKLQPRDARFALGHADFDTKNVGFLAQVPTPINTFDTSKPGNANTGHLYGTDLTPDEKQDLLEYLKQL